jgi:hypothetical protein
VTQPEHERVTGGGGPLGGGNAGGAPPSADSFHSGGPTIRVDFGEVEAAWKQMLEARERFDEALKHAERMTRVQPPGREQPSHNYAGDARNSAQAEHDEIYNMREAADAIAKDLKAQLDSQRDVEDINASGMNGIES